MTKVRGGGLTWKLVQRENTKSGTSEIWRAFADRRLSAARVTATFAKTGYSAAMTVTGFSNAAKTTGAVTAATGSRSAPKVTITPQADKSAVWAVGQVIGSRYQVRKPAGVTLVHGYHPKHPQSGYFVQRASRATTAGEPVTVSSKSRTIHPWGYAAVEIRVPVAKRRRDGKRP